MLLIYSEFIKQKKRFKKTLDEIAADLNAQVHKFTETEAVKKELEDTLYEITKALADLADKTGIIARTVHGNTSMYIIKEIAKLLAVPGHKNVEDDFEFINSHERSMIHKGDSELNRELEKSKSEKETISLQLSKSELQLASVKRELDMLLIKQASQEHKGYQSIKAESEGGSLVQRTEAEYDQLNQEIIQKTAENRELKKSIDAANDELASQRKHFEKIEAGLKQTNKVKAAV